MLHHQVHLKVVFIINICPKLSLVPYNQQTEICRMNNFLLKQTCHSATSMHEMSFPFSGYVIESFFIPQPVITKIINTRSVSTAKYNPAARRSDNQSLYFTSLSCKL